MWKCPKCGREFKNTNQSHFCGEKNHNILHFAVSKNHIGFYPGPEAVAEFKDELKEYKVDKGTIRIPYGNVDTDLIEKIAQWCWNTGNNANNAS